MCDVQSLKGAYEWIKITFEGKGSWGYETMVKKVNYLLYQQIAPSFSIAQS